MSKLVIFHKQKLYLLSNFFRVCIILSRIVYTMYIHFDETKKDPKVKEVSIMATVTAQKWGNSLGIRIPKDAADKIGIEQGSKMELTVVENEGSPVLKPKKVRKKYHLEDLLSQITPENRHDEIDLGRKGRELI